MKKIRLFVLIAFYIFSPILALAQGPGLRIHFIDVGEGDSIFVQAPDGETMLIDAGNLVTGFRVVRYLKQNGVRYLDYLIFTHPHPDHIGGAFFVLQMIDTGRVFDNGQDLSRAMKSIDTYRWYNEFVRGNENYDLLKAGDRLSLGKINFNVLRPAGPPPMVDFNANSLVMMLKYGKFRCLLTGDLTIVGERKLMHQDIDLRADVLKVGHHGAGNATSEEFLGRVSPRIAIISVDAGNIRGYPAKEVVARLMGAGVRVYRTDRDGNIILTVFQSEKGKPKIRVAVTR